MYMLRTTTKKQVENYFSSIHDLNNTQKKSTEKTFEMAISITKKRQKSPQIC